MGNGEIACTVRFAVGEPRKISGAGNTAGNDMGGHGSITLMMAISETKLLIVAAMIPAAPAERSLCS